MENRYLDNIPEKRKNPSRKVCEETIRRILMSDVLQNGQNKHFRNSTDFMSFFESLYAPSDALTKQVQRALKALNMPKDEQGYYIVNKTISQLEEDNQIKRLLSHENCSVIDLSTCESLFLQIPQYFHQHLIHLLEHSKTFENKYVTIVPTNNGLLFYTQNKNQLQILLNSLTN